MRSYNPQPVKALEALAISKGKYFENFPCNVFDSALPQPWLDAFADWCERERPSVTYHMILSSTVYAYCEDYQGPVTCCLEVWEAWMIWDEWERTH